MLFGHSGCWFIICVVLWKENVQGKEVGSAAIKTMSRCGLSKRAVISCSYVV